MKYLVYVKVNGKVSPQLWSMDFTQTLEQRLGTVVEKHELKVFEQSLPLDRLVLKYPYKVKNAKDIISINIDPAPTSGDSTGTTEAV